MLQIAINGNAAELRDFRHLRGFGADALDKLSRYFELKASIGPLPDEIRIEESQAKRALSEGEKFFLAVVAGLEEGYETIVKIFPDPLRTLELKEGTSLTLSGIRTKGVALYVRFPEG
ncbi:MAG: hypothetical protein IH957_12875 [Chloroflexi bacterium]|nr:hypothetical protein [Chloroflexota bacterium]